MPLLLWLPGPTQSTPSLACFVGRSSSPRTPSSWTSLSILGLLSRKWKGTARSSFRLRRGMCRIVGGKFALWIVSAEGRSPIWNTCDRNLWFSSKNGWGAQGRLFLWLRRSFRKTFECQARSWCSCQEFHRGFCWDSNRNLLLFYWGPPLIFHQVSKAHPRFQGWFRQNQTKKQWWKE